MQRFSRDNKVKRVRWRLPVGVTTALAAFGLATAFATAASAAPAPPPAQNVTPGATFVNGTRYVFYTAADGSVWQKTVGSSSAATAVGGRLAGAPSPMYDGTNINVFGEGTDGALWFNTCSPGGGCGSWSSLGGRLTSKPGATDTGSTTYSVYVRGADGAVWALDHSTGFGPWHTVGGQVLSGTGPSAAHNGSPGSDFVLVAGTDKGLWLERVGGPGFAPVGGVTTANPALVNMGTLVGFVRGTNSSAYWHEFTAGTGGWHSMGGTFTSGMAGAATSAETWTYGLGGDSQVWENQGVWNPTPTFTGWIQRTP
jgi:hypothetical protein